MAVQLDTSKGTRDVKAMAEKDRNTKFRIARITLVAITALLIANYVRVGIGGYQDMKAADIKIEELNVAYERVKAEAASYHEQKEAETLRGDDGVEILTQAMYSAKAAGDEVAAIQTDYANEKMVMPSQQARLTELTGQKTGWFGSEVKKPDPSDPESVRFDWEFLTFYDAQVTTYDCIWACWCSSADGSGSRYLVSVRMGRYNGETNTFTMSDADTYTSTFGAMVNKYGSIAAAQGASQTTQDILDMAGQLTDSGLYDDGETDAETDAETEAGTDGTPEEAGGEEGEDADYSPIPERGSDEDVGDASDLDAGNDSV